MTTVRMSDDDLDGIAALTEACKPWNPLREASETLIDEVRRLRAVVDAALALHRQVGHDLRWDNSKSYGFCNHCGDSGPCRTVRALTQ